MNDAQQITKISLIVRKAEREIQSIKQTTKDSKPIELELINAEKLMAYSRIKEIIK